MTIHYGTGNSYILKKEFEFQMHLLLSSYVYQSECQINKDIMQIVDFLYNNVNMQSINKIISFFNESI